MKKFKPLDSKAAEVVAIAATTYSKDKYPLGGKSYNEFDAQAIWWGMCFLKGTLEGIKREKV